MRYIVIILLVFLFVACGTLKAPYYSLNVHNWKAESKTSKKELIHTAFLVGDAGRFDNKDYQINNVLESLKKELKKSTEETSLVFLGDNVYPNGLPSEDNKTRSSKEDILAAQLDLARYVNGDTYFIAGNHDWKSGNKKGLKAIIRQEEYIESFFSKNFPHKVKMYPGNGCGDPKVKKVNKDLYFVFIDSQWWLQNWDSEKKMNKGCDIKSRNDFLTRIEEIFIEHKNDQIVVFMHHPIYSNGIHGGYFSFADHLFPLHREKNLWIPVPVIGSMYPILRTAIGSVQDLNNTLYIEFSQGINQIANDLDVDVIFASGHDHSLQYFDKDNVKQIISGSGSRHSFSLAGGEADFSREARGFVKLLFYEDMEAWAEFYTVPENTSTAKLEFRTQIRKPKAGSVFIDQEYPSIVKKDTTVAANKNFDAGRGKRFFLGNQYRDMWATEVNVPFIDLENRFGGLIPVKKGGGMSSNSLRLEHDNGKQYILRSINKDYTKLVDKKYSELKVLDIMKDQNSASHPYGALMLPSLSKAAGIYYTSPELVFLKHQKQLGNYNNLFPEELYLLEQRPDGDWSDASQFGYSKEIISYNDLLERLREKKHHFVDQEWVLKSRLFDLFIHDWDRHDDQWRWASFEIGDSTLYRPIPRDRDQAFYKFEGLIPWYVSTFIIKKFKTMKGDVKDVKSLSFNARYFDRYFLNQLEWSDWERITKELQASMTDEVIDSCLFALPENVIDLNKEIPELLKSRRDHMIEISRRLYEFLSQEVEITGTDDDEIFEIERLSDGSVNVKCFIERDKKGDLLRYERTFYPSETSEIRLYGLRGKDEFVVKGEDVNKIRIRIIGGEDKDKITNDTHKAGIYAYDEVDGIKLKGDHIIDKTSEDDIYVNEYDRKGFAYNKNFPFIRLGYTKDDGIWFGLSYDWTTNGWRRDPYKAKQKAYFEVAPGNQDAFKFGYDAHFPGLFGKLDYKPSFHVDFPSIENYFGMGNESVNYEREKEYNWVTITGARFNPLISYHTLNKRFIFDFGPAYETVEIQERDGRVALDPLLGFTEEEMERKHFVGGEIHHKIDIRDREENPSNGFAFYAGVEYQYNITDDDDLFRFKTNSQFYVTLSNYPKLVLANNVGYEKISGDYEFYQTPDIGNLTNLRGFRKNRFRGESAFYENVDLRFNAFNWKNAYLPVNMGLVAGYDIGRVWLDDEHSEKWHNSQTVGLWLDVLDTFVMQPYYSFTVEDNFFSFIMRFNF